LRIETPVRLGDPGSARNAGAMVARGSHLAFLDSDDYWKPGRIAWLAPLLDRADLILCMNGDPTEATRDPVAAFLRTNSAITSAAVMRWVVFEKLGGFARFYYGPYKKFVPGWEDYELWLRAILLLIQRGARERILILRNEHVVSEHEPESAGKVGLKNQMLREAFTLVRVLPKVPPRYWAQMPRRLAGAFKAGLLG
jgi:glycosyltransferase involved in cell wall biosynthesis